MAKIFGVNTKISGKVGQLLYRQTKRGTIVSELPVKPAIPRRSARQMDLRTQWGNLAAIYKQFDSKLWDVVDKIGFSVADNCLATSQQITNGAALRRIIDTTK